MGGCVRGERCASMMASSPARDAPSLDVRDASSSDFSDPLPVVTVEEIDAPHIASLVEQYHGPWRKTRGHPTSQRGDAFAQVRTAVCTEARAIPLTVRSDKTFFSPSDSPNIPKPRTHLFPTIRRGGSRWSRRCTPRPATLAARRPAAKGSRPPP